MNSLTLLGVVFITPLRVSKLNNTFRQDRLPDSESDCETFLVSISPSPRYTIHSSMTLVHEIIGLKEGLTSAELKGRSRNNRVSDPASDFI